MVWETMNASLQPRAYFATIFGFASRDSRLRRTVGAGLPRAARPAMAQNE